MSQIYETAPIAVDVAGAPVFLEVPFPSRISVKKVIVVQTAGALEDFTVELFNNGSVMALTPGPPMVPGEELYRVCPPLHSDAPGLLSRLGEDFVFYSHEETQDRPTVNRRVLYVRITPTSPAPKTYNVLLGAKADS